MKNFFDTKDEKITEKAFSQSLIISVASILLCLIALCSATYAWFTTSTESASNTMIAGFFDLNATATFIPTQEETLPDENLEAGETDENAPSTVQQEEIATTQVVPVIKDANGTMTCTLEKIGTYEIILTITEESTVKGFCSVSIDGTTEISTAPLGILIGDSQDKITTLKFTITTTKENTVVQLKPKWGYPADILIKDGGEYPWTVNTPPVLDEGEKI